MLNFQVTECKRFIHLVKYDSDAEYIAFRKFFKRKDKSAYYSPLYTAGISDGYDDFVKNQHYVSSGLWNEISDLSKDTGLQCGMAGMEKIQGWFDEAHAREFAEKLLENTSYSAYGFQMEGFLRIMKYKYCMLEFATSSGKTIIAYMITAYAKSLEMVSRKKKMLIVVSNKTDLVNQTYKKFAEEYSNGYVPLNIMLMGGKNKYSDEAYDQCEVVITTYNSLIRRDKEFFKDIGCVIIDEAHSAAGKSIEGALLECRNLFLRVGLSGTIDIDKGYSTLFKIQQNIGPIVMKYTAKQLMDDGYSPDVVVQMIQLYYDDVMTDSIRDYKKLLKEGRDMYLKPEDFGKDMYNIEAKLVRENQSRIDFIYRLTNKLGKNTLILFNDVVGEYGLKLTAKLQENPDRQTYYIAGKISNKKRDEFKAIMEANENVTIVASFKTFSTGIDINRLHHIILSESYKAEILTRQTIGRGMRSHESKTEILIIDLVDMFGKYVKSHSYERMSIYKEQQFTVEKHEYSLKPCIS